MNLALDNPRRLIYHCSIPMIRICVKWIYNVHIYITQNIGSRNTKNTYDFSVQVRIFLLPFSLKVFRHKETEAQSLYSGFFVCPTPISYDTCPRPRRASESQPSRPVSSHNSLTDFFKISQNPPRSSGAWRHSVAPVSHLGLLWHRVTRPLRMRAWTPAFAPQ